MSKTVKFVIALSITTFLSLQSGLAERVECPKPDQILRNPDSTGYYGYKYYADTTGAMKIKLIHNSPSQIIWYNTQVHAKTGVYGFEGKLVCTYVDPSSTNPQYSPSLYSEVTYPTCKASADGTYFDCPKEAIGQVQK